MAQSVPIRLTLIGRFALWRGSQELGITASGQRLIALLALSDRPVGRLHVAGTLWPDYARDRSLAHLRIALWRVNHSSGRVIAVTPSLLTLDAGIEVDVRNVVAFAHRLARADNLDLDSVEAADLASDLLPDWYDDWVTEEREGLRQTRLHALENLARRLSASGRRAHQAVTPMPSRPRSWRSAWSRCARPHTALSSRSTWPRGTGRRRTASSSDTESCSGKNSASSRPIRCACRWREGGRRESRA
jgi:hypothetical protein